MLERTGMRLTTAALVGAIAMLSAGAGDGARLLEFAAEMAERGNWREAHYRWTRLVDSSPDDARLLNNLAVAEETFGNVDRSRELYARALEIAPRDEIVRENSARSRLFWAQALDEDLDPSAARAAAIADRVKPGRKAERVRVELPVPPRFDLGERRTVLVASFLTGDDEVLDANREITRYLRGEFAARTSLEVLDVTPPPAIPEQTLDELAANDEFWRFLGRRQEADIIVSGRIRYDRMDVSGFQDVDRISAATGQKVRSSQFVEAEEFRYVLDLLFLDGRDGSLLHRDSVSRAVRYEGLGNDPISAFHGISDGLAAEVLSVILPRRRVDDRVIFKR